MICLVPRLLLDQTGMATRRGLSFLGRGVPEVARTILLKNKAWIGGKWLDALSENTYPVYNPYNMEIIAEVSGRAGQKL